MKKQRRAQDRIQDIFGDILKRVPVAELKLPKTKALALLSSIENMRQSVQQTFAAELSDVLSKMDFDKIANDLATNYTLKVNAEIRLEPKNRKISAKKKK